MGHPKLIIANNVMAHVPDLQDFVAGLAQIAGPETIISIENPSLLNLTENNQFDTIYHEHFSYLTAHSVAKMVDAFGLELFDLEKIKYPRGVPSILVAGQKIANETSKQSCSDFIRIVGGLFDNATGRTSHCGFKHSQIFTIGWRFHSWRGHGVWLRRGS